MDLSGPKNFKIPVKEICLDDIPVDTIIYRGNKQGTASPADIVLLWANGFSLSEKLQKVLVMLLDRKSVV